MASKKNQGELFMSQTEKLIPAANRGSGAEVPAESFEPEEKTINKGGRPKSRGEVHRSSVFLDADLYLALKLQAAVEGKSVSVLISDIVRDYLTDKGMIDKAKEFSGIV